MDTCDRRESINNEQRQDIYSNFHTRSVNQALLPLLSR